MIKTGLFFSFYKKTLILILVAIYHIRLQLARSLTFTNSRGKRVNPPEGRYLFQFRCLSRHNQAQILIISTFNQGLGNISAIHFSFFFFFFYSHRYGKWEMQPMFGSALSVSVTAQALPFIVTLDHSELKSLLP